QGNEVTALAGQVDAVSEKLFKEVTQTRHLAAVYESFQGCQPRSGWDDADTRAWVSALEFFPQQLEIAAVAGDGFFPRLRSRFAFEHNALPATIAQALAWPKFYFVLPLANPAAQTDDAS